MWFNVQCHGGHGTALTAFLTNTYSFLGKVTFSWKSFATIYAVIFYICATVVVVIVGRERLTILQTTKKFDDKIYAIVFVIFLIPHFWIPFVGWGELYFQIGKLISDYWITVSAASFSIMAFKKKKSCMISALNVCFRCCQSRGCLQDNVGHVSSSILSSHRKFTAISKTENTHRDHFHWLSSMRHFVFTRFECFVGRLVLNNGFLNYNNIYIFSIIVNYCSIKLFRFFALAHHR